MRRRIAFIMIILMMFSVSIAETVDLSVFSDQELESLKARIVSELEARNPVEITTVDFPLSAPVLLVNEDGLKLYLTGRDKKVWGNDYYYIGFAFENESGRSLSVWTSENQLNGWNTSRDIISTSIETGQKNTGELTVFMGDALLTEYSQLQELIFKIEFDDENYNAVKSYGPYKFLFHFED